MTSRTFKSIFILTSFSPILVIMYLINVVHNWGLKSPQSFFEIIEIFMKEYYFILLLLILLLICVIMVKYANRRLERFKINVVSIAPAGKDVFSLLFAYLLPLVMRSSSGINIGMLIIFAICLFIVSFNSHSYHFNPLLGFIGYRCYEIKTDTGIHYTLLTKKDIRSCKNVKGVVYITDYMVLEA